MSDHKGNSLSPEPCVLIPVLWLACIAWPQVVGGPTSRGSRVPSCNAGTETIR